MVDLVCAGSINSRDEDEVSMNNSDSNFSPDQLQLCSPVQPVPGGGYGLMALNAFSIILNGFHIFVLSKMRSLKGSVYLHILVHLSAADMIYALRMIFQSVFADPSLFKSLTVGPVAFYWSFNAMCLWIRFWIMAAASFERYYALCRALTYESSRIISSIPIWLPIVWLVCYATAVVFMVSLELDLCFSRLVGPMFRRSDEFMVTMYTMQLAPGVFTAILLAQVLVELYRMRKRYLTNDEKQVKAATKYLIAIMALLYAGLLPPLFTNAILQYCPKCLPKAATYFCITQQLFPSLYQCKR
jgi:hypothetical protein